MPPKPQDENTITPPKITNLGEWPAVEEVLREIGLKHDAIEEVEAFIEQIKIRLRERDENRVPE